MNLSFQVSDPYSAQMIAVMPAKHNGSGAICKLYKSKYPDEVDGKVRCILY